MLKCCPLFQDNLGHLGPALTNRETNNFKDENECRDDNIEGKQVESTLQII